MPYAVGDVVRMTISVRSNRFEGVFKNVLHYRGVEGTATTAQMATWIETDAIPTYLSRYMECLTDQEYLGGIKLENLTDLDEPAVDSVYGTTEFEGSVNDGVFDVPQAAACITRKSFLRGRKSIGHVYFGPLPSAYTNKGLLTPTPLLDPELMQVIECLGDPLINPVTGWECRPIVCNAEGTGVVANNDIRVQTFGRLAVFLKSRRPGIGE